MNEEILGNITLYNCDCMDYMATCRDNEFDLAIADPEYGINAPNMQMGHAPNRKGKGQYPGESTAVKLKGRLNSGGGKLKDRILNKSKISWDNEKPKPEYFKEIFRISKNQIIWGGNYFTDNLQESRCWICWDKIQPWENFSQFELAWTSFDKPAAMYRYSNTGGANKEKKIHPTQKPVKLYEWLLRYYAKPGQKIFDSHFGSLSIGIACHNLGFELTACELDKEYYEAAKKRLQIHQMQKTIFDYIK